MVEAENSIAEKQRELSKMRKAYETLEQALMAAEEAFGGSTSGSGSSSSRSIDRRNGGSVTKPHRGSWKQKGRGKNSHRGSYRGRGGGKFGPPGRGGYGGYIAWG